MKNEPFVRQSEVTLSIPYWNELDNRVHAGISLRNGGISKPPYDSLNLGLHVGDLPEDVIRNREILGEQIGELDNWVVGEQIHGNEIKKVSREDRGKGATSLESAVKQVDGLYTGETNVVLTAFYADCVPLYFFAPDHGMIGIAHAGWKGTVDGMAKRFVDTWVQKEHIKPSHIYAAVGPSIGACCYEVDDRVIGRVKDIMPFSNESPYTDVGEGRYMLDLKLLNKQILLESGIPETNLSVTGYCTSCQKDFFYSHRRDGGKSGRMMGFIVMKEV